MNLLARCAVAFGTFHLRVVVMGVIVLGFFCSSFSVNFGFGLYLEKFRDRIFFVVVNGELKLVLEI